jgi:hypothetical protein
MLVVMARPQSAALRPTAWLSELSFAQSSGLLHADSSPGTAGTPPAARLHTRATPAAHAATRLPRLTSNTNDINNLMRCVPAASGDEAGSVPDLRLALGDGLVAAAFERELG